MKIDLFKPFITASIAVLKEVASANIAKKKVFSTQGKVSSEGTGVIIDLVGDIKGKVIYEFSRMFTMRISSQMIKEAKIAVSSVEEYKQLLESALKELANMISGRALGLIKNKQQHINISFPEVYVGKGFTLAHTDQKIFVIDLKSAFGEFSINLLLEDN